MVINTNVSALNIVNTNARADKSLSKSLSNLSSGYRINSAADDAAGLAISEKMRSQIRGLETATFNSSVGSELISTAEGALDEVHSMLDRLKLLATESSNGVLTDKDRESLQSELEQICGEVDRIAQSTKYNGIHLFQQYGKQFERLSNAYWDTSGLFSKLGLDTGDYATIKYVGNDVYASSVSTPDKLVYVGPKSLFEKKTFMAPDLDEQMREIAKQANEQAQAAFETVSERVYAYEAVQSRTAVDETSVLYETAVDSAQYPELKQALSEQIVPSAVSGLIEMYGEAAEALKGESIGIGLRLYSDSSSSVASLSSETLEGGEYVSYQLSINVANLELDENGQLTEQGRASLEQTVAHEMAHAFMFEIAPEGMHGISSDGFVDEAELWPEWFAEGMAQAASGARDWLTSASGLAISAQSSLEQIAQSLSENALTQDTAASNYGTGYLACMFLAHEASGATLEQMNAQTLAAGMQRVLRDVRDLGTVDEMLRVAGKNGLDDFEQSFSNDTKVQQFTKELMYKIGGGAGSLLSRDLSSEKALPDNAGTEKLNLFELDTEKQVVVNLASDRYGMVVEDVSRVANANAPTATPPGPLTINGTALGITSTSGAGWSYNAVTGELLITGAGATYTIGGGMAGSQMGKIRVADGITGNNLLNPTTIVLDNVSIDQSLNSGGAAFDTGKNNAALKIVCAAGSTNTFKSGYDRAGIEIGEGSIVNITGSGTATIEATGGQGGAGIGSGKSSKGGDINIGSNLQVKATGGNGAAGIGSGENGTIEIVTVSDSSIVATGGLNAAGIGAGYGGKCVGIAISSATVTATGGMNGAGIGSGSQGECDYIKLDDSIIEATGGSNSAGIGGAYRGEVGDISTTNCEVIATGNGAGAGIGAGGYSSCGDIEIFTGTITATGGNYGGAGIGGGDGSPVGDIYIEGAKVNATALQHGAGIGGGWGGNAKNGTITIVGGDVTAIGVYHGGGIGAGCSGSSGKISIYGNGKVVAQGGFEGSGIGASWNGSCADIEISGNMNITATGGNYGAGIGAGGSNSKLNGDIVINSGTINATGGHYGAGIGAGGTSSTSSYNTPTVTGTIDINGGNITANGGNYGAGIGSGERGAIGEIDISGSNTVVYAEGAQNGAGIGGGRWGTGGDISISDAVVTAIGGLSNDGGNIGNYTDSIHTKPAKLTIKEGTSVQASGKGEGLYNTSGATDAATGNPIYSYPLPLTFTGGRTVTKIENVGKISNTGYQWAPDTTHDPLDPDHAYIWMRPENQKVTVTYSDGTVDTLDLIWYPKAGVWRLGNEPAPPDAIAPDNVSNPDPALNPEPTPDTDVEPPEPEEPTDDKGFSTPVYTPSEVVEIMQQGYGGIVLQIGASRGEIMVVPQFYFSSKALNLTALDISQQQLAMDSLGTIERAIDRVSTMRGEYGALQNRLGHNISNLTAMSENMTAAESAIRDLDMAKEYTKMIKHNVILQAGQSMLAQANQQPQRVLELLQQ